ncbi:MAG: OmpA family protein [Cyclobacteriaceae bacterium]|nr:OmpA family protein [Cyclobacteriaceae bacterium]
MNTGNLIRNYLRVIKKSAAIICMLVGNISFAQQVQWASRVISFSSELSPKEFAARQVIGKPDVLPAGGDNPNAWLPSDPNGEEYILVGFDQPQRIQQIAIAESFNPTAIYQLFVYDIADKEYLISTFTPRPVNLNGRLLNVFFDQTPHEVHAVKVVLRGILVPGYNGIDAIGIADSKIPVSISIDVAAGIPENIVIEKLDNTVNSEYKETRPLLSPDGQTLYFSRRNHPENTGGTADPEDIWYSEYDHLVKDWNEAQNIGRPLNNAGANYISSISPDGNAMTVILGNQYQKNDRMKPGVSMSTRTSEGWSNPVPLDIINPFIENNDGDYFLAQNRKMLIFAIERFDSFGGKDIYISFQMANGRWTEPLNLGNDINTAGMENAPFLAADDETLYFSSNGYSGYGGSDIFISRRLDESWQNWTTPENLGNQINSEEEDIFFNIPPSGQYAYFSKGNTEYDADIFRVELPVFFQPSPVVTVFGSIFNAGTLKPVRARVNYELLPEMADLGYTISDSITGEYEIVMPVGSKFRYRVDFMGFNVLEDTIDLVELKNYQEINRDLYLDPEKINQAMAVHAVKTGEKNGEKAIDHEQPGVVVDGEGYDRVEDAFEINDGVISLRVQFDFDSYHIRKSTYPDLDRIINLLKNTPTDIIIAGHTCDIGSGSYNLILSESRAKAVFEYLVEKGVDPDKLVTTGYGMERPLESNKTMEGKNRNRRVEFIRRDQFIRYNYKYENN